MGVLYVLYMYRYLLGASHPTVGLKWYCSIALYELKAVFVLNLDQFAVAAYV